MGINNYIRRSAELIQKKSEKARKRNRGLEKKAGNILRIKKKVEKKR